MEEGSKRELDRLRQRARRQGVAIRTQKASSAGAPSTYSLVDRETGAVLHSGIGDLAGIEALLSGALVVAPTGALADPPSDIPIDASSDLPTPASGDPPADAPSVAPVIWRAPDEICPSCGTPRVGHFRWCRSCGLDYEAYKESDLAIGSIPAQAELITGPPELNVAPPELIGGPPELVPRAPETIDAPFKLAEPPEPPEPPEPDLPEPSDDVPPPPPPLPRPRPVLQRPSSARLAVAGLTDAVREWYPIAHWRQVLLAGILALSAGALVALMSGGVH